MMEKMMYILGKRIERCEANINIGDLEQPMLFPDQTQAQSPQELDSDQDMYDDKHFIEDDEQAYKESNEEGCQEKLDFLPMSCTMLIRELHDLNAKIFSDTSKVSLEEVRKTSSLKISQHKTKKTVVPLF